MQSLLPHAQLFCRAIVAVILAANFCTLTFAQVYQSRPSSSLRYQPSYINPNSQQQTYQPQIYPGQIINGERVVSPSVSPAPQYPIEPVNPPRPPESGSDSQAPSSKEKSPDKVPETIFPIPKGPTLQLEPVEKSAPAAIPPVTQTPRATDPIPTERASNSESSTTAEEQIDLSQPKNPVQNQPVNEYDEIVEESTEPSLGDLPAIKIPEDYSLDAPLMDDTSSEAPSTLPQLSVTSSTDEPSLDLFANEKASTMEAPTAEPPLMDAPGDQSSPDLSPTEEDWMAEIKEIRDQLGGSISETLDDIEPMSNLDSIKIASPENGAMSETDADVSADEMFNEQLRSVMSEQKTVGPSDIDSFQTSSQIQPTDTARTEELRNCARELEQLAGRLEKIEAYENADQIRRQAVDLWTSARQR